MVSKLNPISFMILSYRQMRNRIEDVSHIDYFNFSLKKCINVLNIKKNLRILLVLRGENVTDILHHTSIRKHFCWAWLPKCNVFKKKIFLKFLQECYESPFIFLLRLPDKFICIILRLNNTKINNPKE